MIPSKSTQIKTAIDGLGQSQTVTMTSLELVEFINSDRKDGDSELRHDDFLRKVPKVLGEAIARNFTGYYKALNGKQNPMYRFPKREACLMAMSYSYELQAKVFDKMTALESRPIDPMQVLNDPVALRGLLSGYTEKVIALECKVAEQAPKVAALERIAGTDGLVCLQAAGKLLGQPPNKFIQWLFSLGTWIHKRGGRYYYAYAEKERAGLLVMKLTDITKDGKTISIPQCLVTYKGLVAISRILGVIVNSEGDLFKEAA